MYGRNTSAYFLDENNVLRNESNGRRRESVLRIARTGSLVWDNEIQHRAKEEGKKARRELYAIPVPPSSMFYIGIILAMILVSGLQMRHPNGKMRCNTWESKNAKTTSYTRWIYFPLVDARIMEEFSDSNNDAESEDMERIMYENSEACSDTWMEPVLLPMCAHLATGSSGANGEALNAMKDVFAYATSCNNQFRLGTQRDLIVFGSHDTLYLFEKCLNTTPAYQSGPSHKILGIACDADSNPPLLYLLKEENVEGSNETMANATQARITLTSLPMEKSDLESAWSLRSDLESGAWLEATRTGAKTEELIPGIFYVSGASEARLVVSIGSSASVKSHVVDSAQRNIVSRANASKKSAGNQQPLSASEAAFLFEQANLFVDSQCSSLSSDHIIVAPPAREHSRLMNHIQGRASVKTHRASETFKPKAGVAEATMHSEYYKNSNAAKSSVNGKKNGKLSFDSRHGLHSVGDEKMSEILAQTIIKSEARDRSTERSSSKSNTYHGENNSTTAAAGRTRCSQLTTRTPPSTLSARVFSIHVASASSKNAQLTHLRCHDRFNRQFCSGRVKDPASFPSCYPSHYFSEDDSSHASAFSKHDDSTVPVVTRFAWNLRGREAALHKNRAENSGDASPAPSRDPAFSSKQPMERRQEECVHFEPRLLNVSRWIDALTYKDSVHLSSATLHAFDDANLVKTTRDAHDGKWKTRRVRLDRSQMSPGFKISLLVQSIPLSAILMGGNAPDGTAELYYLAETVLLGDNLDALTGCAA